jgi:hypothetical protein
MERSGEAGIDGTHHQRDGDRSGWGVVMKRTALVVSFAPALAVGIAGPATAQTSEDDAVAKACAAWKDFADALNRPGGHTKEVNAAENRLKKAVQSNPGAFPRVADALLQGDYYLLGPFCPDQTESKPSVSGPETEEACAALEDFDDAVRNGAFPGDVKYDEPRQRLLDALKASPDAFPQGTFSEVRDDYTQELYDFCHMTPKQAAKAAKASKARARKRACAAADEWHDALGHGDVSGVSDAEDVFTAAVLHNKKAFPKSVVDGVGKVPIYNYKPLFEFCDSL